MAILQQSNSRHKNHSSLPTMRNQDQRTKNEISATDQVHAKEWNSRHTNPNVRQRSFRPNKNMENDRGEDNITNGCKRPSLAQQPLQTTERRGRTNGRNLSQMLGPNSTAHTYKRQLMDRWRIHISRNRDCQSQYANICRKLRRPQVNYI